MFSRQHDAARKASKVARFFADYKRHKSHSIGIFREAVRRQGVVIDDLEKDQPLQDAVLSVFHATMLTFNFSGCIKLIENSLGRGYYVQQQQILVQPMQPQMQPAQQPQPPQQPPA